MARRMRLPEIAAKLDDYSKRLGVTQIAMSALARGEVPDTQDSTIMPDGTIYAVRVFGVARACGGVVVIGFTGYGTRHETFDAQYFDDALIAARATVTAMPDAYAYRDMFDRLEKVVRKLQMKVA